MARFITNGFIIFLQIDLQPSLFKSFKFIKKSNIKTTLQKNYQLVYNLNILPPTQSQIYLETYQKSTTRAVI